MNTQYNKISQEEENENENCFLRVLCWFFQILLWVNIATVIILYIKENNYWIHFTIALQFTYLIYSLLELSSPTCYYLFHKNAGIEINKKMKEILSLYPQIKFKIKCYHYKTSNINCYRKSCYS